jgi:hypothetical protein
MGRRDRSEGFDVELLAAGAGIDPSRNQHRLGTGG